MTDRSGRRQSSRTFGEAKICTMRYQSASTFLSILMLVWLTFSQRSASSQPRAGDQFLTHPGPLPSEGSNRTNGSAGPQQQHVSPQNNQPAPQSTTAFCLSGLLTFELSTGFIYKPSSTETLAIMPSTLQLTDCLDYCLRNTSCLAINFEMGLCVLLSSSAKHNPGNLYTSQFPVFTIYAEKKCLLAGDPQAARQKRRCQRAWTFESVAGYEMKTKARRKLKLASKELCMESCLTEREFECRSANWYKHTGECTLSDQDRHSVSQSEAGDQRIKTSSLQQLYGPSNLTTTMTRFQAAQRPSTGPSSNLYENYYTNDALLHEKLIGNGQQTGLKPTMPFVQASSMDRDLKRRSSETVPAKTSDSSSKFRRIRQLFDELQKFRLTWTKSSNSSDDVQATMTRTDVSSGGRNDIDEWANQYVDRIAQQQQQIQQQLVVDSPVDYLENNCIYEPNKLCEFRKIQNRVLKTVDSIYQDVVSVEDCKQKCLNAPYRCYSFDYGDTSDRVCRTSHLDQASLLAVKEPYLDVVGAITYELASCFNVTIQCRAKEMVALVSSSKMFKGKIYAKTRPSTCVNDVAESLKFELSMNYNDEACNVKSSSTSLQGVFSNDIVIQHHDRIVTTQDVGLSVYCQYDLGNRSITNNVDLAIEKIDSVAMESKQNQSGTQNQTTSGNNIRPGDSSSSGSPLLITGLATTVVKSPNVTMRITNMNGMPVTSATVGDRLALLFEIKEKSSPFGIFVREIVAMDGKQIMQNLAASTGKPGAYHYHGSGNESTNGITEQSLDYMIQTETANSIQFIDSDGCPTDANIMGPLIKMDPAGHRILAPFDAFKFPSSEMVFFRAVVTSCVSECAPVICPGASEPTPSYTPPSALHPRPVTTQTTPSHSTGTQRAQPASRLPMTQLQMSTNDEMSPAQSTTILDINATSPSTIHENFEKTASTPQMYRSSSTVVTNPQLYPTGIPLSSTGGTIEFGANKSRFQSSPTPSETSSSTLGSSSSATSSATESTTTTPYTIFYAGTTANLPPNTFSDARHRSTSISAGNGDSLTTIPGYNEPDNAVWSPNGQPIQVGDMSELNRQNFVNITNNHQGKPPPRPSTTAIPPGSSFNLNLMSEQQKQQIVKLFETRLKLPDMQQNRTNIEATGNGSHTNANSVSDLADLYTGFLTSLMLKDSNNSVDGNGNTNQEDGNYKRNDNGYNGQMIDFDGSNHPDTSDRATDQATSNSDILSMLDKPIVLADLEALLHFLASKSNDSSFDEITQRLESMIDSAASGVSSSLHPSVPQKSSSAKKDAEDTKMNDELVQMRNAQLLLKNLAQQSFDDYRMHPAQPQPPQSDATNEFNFVNQGQQLQQESGQESAAEILKQIRSQQQLKLSQQLQHKATGGNNKSEANKTMADNKSISTPAQHDVASNRPTVSPKQKKRDKANLQALADSYLGALQTMGKRRRKRSDDNYVKQKTTPLDLPGYIYMEQSVAPSDLQDGNNEHSMQDMRFTQAVVELYHTNADEPPKKVPRSKRQAPQPIYDMDEMVVQSIKIVDRLHFEDETPDGIIRVDSGKLKSASKQKMPRSSIVTQSSALAALDNQDDDPNNLNSGQLVSWSSAGVLSIVLMAVSFVFVQVFLVAIYLLDCSRRRAIRKSSHKLNNGSNSVPSCDYSTWGASSSSGGDQASHLYDQMTLASQHQATISGSNQRALEQPLYLDQIHNLQVRLCLAEQHQQQQVEKCLFDGHKSRMRQHPNLGRSQQAWTQLGYQTTVHDHAVFD